MRVLQSYERMSRQLVSPNKSSIYFSSSFSLTKKEEAMRIYDFTEGAWPCIYLGVALHVKRLRLRMFDPFLAKVQKKLAGWKSKLLSFGGKIMLLKHVLNSMPIHLLSRMNLPKGVLKGLKTIFSNFL